MGDIHHFQRYSSKENVITNNTLRLLGQVYNDEPERLETLLGSVVDGTTVDIDLQMAQQESGPDSIPDGALFQPSLRIVLETKRGNSFSTDQLKRHLHAFDGEDQKVLLLLTPREVESDDLDEVREAAQERNAVFGNVTFDDLIGALIGEDGIVSEYETDLRSIVRDYESFCSEQDLLPDDDVMRAVPCGDTHELNVEQDLYYMPASRGYRSHQFIGVYSDMSIHHIGRLVKDVEVDRVGSSLEGETEDLTEDQLGRIRGAMDQRPGIEQGHRFMLVDEFYPTDFSKASKYGMRGAQYFSLREHLGIGESGDLPSTEEIAERLEYASWE
jgi:hypothetical protein